MNCDLIALQNYRQRRSCKAFTGLSNRAKTVGRPSWLSLLREFLAETDALPSKTQISYRYSLIVRIAASAVTPSEKVQLTRIGSPLRAFQWV